ncbi:MAG: hypothetical protein OWQ48_03020 [Desulfurococcus sp.]|nr:hypothetical protein [Desulfurococcus sp.]
MREKPFLASGKILGGYPLLVKYFEICSSEKKSPECAELLPTRGILEEISVLVSRDSKTFIEILEKLEESLAGKVDCTIAVKAYDSVYGVKPACSEAVKALLREVVAWYLEIAEALGLVKLSKSWERRE